MRDLLIFIMLFSFSLQVCLSLIFFYTYIYRKNETANIFFGFIFLASALYAFSQFIIFSSTSMSITVIWQRIQLIGPAALGFFYPMAMLHFVGIKNSKVPYVFAALLLVFIAILIPTELIITSMPVYYSGFMLQGDIGPLYPVFMAVIILGLSYGFVKLILATRRHTVMYSTPIIISSAIAMASGILDIIRDIFGLNLHFASFFTVGIMVFALVMGYSLIRRFLHGYHKLDYDERYIRQLHFKAQKEYVDLLAFISQTLDAKDRYTSGHSENVGRYAEMLAKKLGLPEGDIKNLRTASLLHDIGKLAIPDSILQKPGLLTPEEYGQMKQHPVIGVELLSNVSDFVKILSFILYHHERIDGKGYPHGLKGDQIPIQSRIISIADTYDAVTTDRLYRKAFPKDKAIDIMMEASGTQLDSFLVSEFIKLVK